MDIESWALCQPVPNDRCLVSAVVVEHEVNVQIVRHLGLNDVQTPAELHRAMAPVELTNDTAGLQIQCGKRPKNPTVQRLIDTTRGFVILPQWTSEIF